MDDEKIEIDCRLLARIKKLIEESKDSQIILTGKDGSLIRASCYSFSAISLNETPRVKPVVP